MARCGMAVPSPAWADGPQSLLRPPCRHKFFNTNNLWVNLPKLKAALDAAGETRAQTGWARLPRVEAGVCERFDQSTGVAICWKAYSVWQSGRTPGDPGGSYLPEYWTLPKPNHEHFTLALTMNDCPASSSCSTARLRLALLLQVGCSPFP